MYQALIDFWFSDEAKQYWFKSTRWFDQRLIDSYIDTWRQAKQGKLDRWQQTAMGSLALVIVLDQFPLNMFRGTAKSFSTGAMSLDVARGAIEKAYDGDLASNQKSFMYMPGTRVLTISVRALRLILNRRHFGIVANLRWCTSASDWENRVVIIRLRC